MNIDISSFKPIEGFDGRYMIDRDGNILSVYRGNHRYIDDRPMLLRPSLDSNGYKIVSLAKGKKKRITCKVHRLVALTFLPNPQNKKYVCHKDNNKLNCNVENLYWGTPVENIRQAFDDGLYKKAQPIAKMNLDGNVIAVYLNQSRAGQANNIHRAIISMYLSKAKNKNIKNPKWKRITREEYEYYKSILND